jgi:hypothetical protein
VATFPVPPAFTDEREDVDADVTLTDAHGREVVHATISLRISPRPARTPVPA